MTAKYVINGRFLSRKLTGVDRYAYEIIRELDKICEPGIFELAVPHSVSDIPVLNNIRIRKTGINKGNLWEQIDFCLYAILNNRKTINLCNTGPLLKTDLITIFDTKINDHPEFYSKVFVMWYKLQFSTSLRKAKAVITDSYSARNDILRNYPAVNDDKLTVIYPSWQHMNRITGDEKVLEKYSLEDKGYYFSIGNREPNKNLKWVINAGNDNPDETFIIAGKTDDIYKDEQYKITSDNIRLIGYISDEEAKSLMKHCKAFIFPSFAEGFGFPPLEALSSDCKSLIVSDIPVMHEIYDNTVTYIDPYRYKSGDLDFRVINDDRKKILSRFDWRDSAVKLFKVIKDNL